MNLLPLLMSIFRYNFFPLKFGRLFFTNKSYEDALVSIMKLKPLQRHNLQESTDLTRCRGRTCSARKVGVTLSVRIRIAGQVYLADKFTGSLIILLRTWNQAIFTVSRKSLPNSYLSMRGVPLRPYWALD